MTLARFPRGLHWLLLALAAALPASGRGAPVPLPQSFLFEPLLADPKRPRFFISVIDARVGALETTAAAVAYGGRYGLVRLPGDRYDEGWQLNLAGAVFAQFDLEAPSMDLINADYTLGLPLTYRDGPGSLRLQVYHQSSHLGDEFLLRNHPERVNLQPVLEVLSDLRAPQRFGCKAGERRRGGATSSEPNAAGGALRGSLRACLSAPAGGVALRSDREAETWLCLYHGL